MAAFAALVEHRHFNVAAANLFLTQSAVSHAIKALEEDVGSQLFNRTRRQVILTEAGERFREYIDKILSEMRAARLEMEQLSAQNQRQLWIGANTLTLHYVLPQILQEFQKSFPACKVKLKPGKLADLLEPLRANKIDFAIGLDSLRPDDLVFEPLLKDELLFFVSAEHPWARLRRISPEAVAQETFILPLKDGINSAMLERLFRAEKIMPAEVTAPGSLEAAKRLVSAGFGVGVFTPWQVAAEAAAGSLRAVPLTKKRMVRHWVLVRRKGSAPLPLQQEFIDRCNAAFQALDASSPAKE